MQNIDFQGQIFFLSDDENKILAQLSGQRLTLAHAIPLRDDVSTDEMTSQAVCARYEDFGDGLLSAYRAGDAQPIPELAFRGTPVTVMVAGKRYGKGSSREHSPLAHKTIGVRLIIAESFERIFRQNCDNLGIFTSTDMSLADRISAGEAIAIDELVAGREALAARLLRAGGLLNLDEDAIREFALTTRPADGAPRTLTQKILQRHAIVADQDFPAGSGSFVRTDWRFSHEYYTGMIANLLHHQFGDPVPLSDPDRIILFEDHLTFAHRSPVHVNGGLLPGVERMSRRHQAFGIKYGITNHGYLPAHEGSEGICHAIMIERYAMPGEVVVGTDSHTTHSGALGALAFGVGSSDMAYALKTGNCRLTVPDSILIRLDGKLPEGVASKDIVLHLAARPELKRGSGLGKVFEFAGEAVDAMSTDERTTLTNMTAELGGFTGIVAPDAETVRFLKERRGVDFALQEWMKSDEGAPFSEIVTVDCSLISPVVAAPGDPGNAIPLSELVERPSVDIAYGGSCTGGKREDFDEYFKVLDWADRNGLKAQAGVTLFLQFGTLAVRDYCEEQGYLPVFERVGAEMLMPSCGACAGCGPGSSSSHEEVTVSAINRNFPGRSGPGQVWLGSPATVAASAIAGRLVSFDELKQQAAMAR
ncbi:aconitase family protein [Croceicoccus marinus]|uniref:3-isopropylmalate dehydratase n=1 Tax=Croceicoccus marinus TaxID=450378 RepID=A0A1Z1F8E5_9SPHN|nr:aconitase family protein [Croceicoccus marinus]ARU15012.1 3-isopropylmalate dehydratase [Croceicoccus marinus]